MQNFNRKRQRARRKSLYDRRAYYSLFNHRLINFHLTNSTLTKPNTIKRLTVGGITFSIRAADVSFLQPVPEKNYTEFESEVIFASGPFDIDVLIKTATGGNLPNKNLHLAYTSDSCWSLYRTENGYVIQLQPVGLDKPMWEAETNADFSEVIVQVHIPQPRGKHSLEHFYPFRYPLDQILLIYYLGMRKGILIHSAGVTIGEKGYILPGISGAGKSTISSAFLKNDTFQVINDDRMVIRHQNDKYQAYGTPWPGDAGIAINSKKELNGILFLNKATENRIEEISPQKAFEKLLPVASIPWHDKEIVLNLFEFCEQMVRSVPAYNLYFTPSPDLNDLILEAVG